MWPRLVASKLLHRLSSSNSSSAADFPSTTTATSNWDEIINLQRSCNDGKETRNYKLFASTWNVGGMAPPSDDLNLEDWLHTRNESYDIYVLGFQEIVPLSAKNVFGPEKTRVAAKWNSLIGAALNRSSPFSEDRREAKVGEQRVHPVGEGTARSFHCILSKQMVGILVSVWVRADIRRCIRHAGVCCVGCGFMGCLGNKGSISVRFCFHETSFCVVCCHLASGGKEGDELHRNSDVMEIFSRTCFLPRPSLDLPTKIFDHDRVILLGDLNYRISLPEATTVSLVEQKNWNVLLEKDQLRTAVSVGRVFDGWHEGAVTFSPTYKYYPNSDEYYGCIQRKKGEKRRVPAWCDRIMWHGNGIKQKLYERCESKLSDHRPVRSIFDVEVEVVTSLTSPRSF
ncbi:type I inositol-1,4,5-trisphosphate 5-phosphatase [Musa troglodytarum]|uniref:Type I inositol-1,4,5-trisphosphate 5-phosphatase n=1 Tax=Musa troglodytarum TaxID=320322 RepID=A0A9E7KGU9_9LILI|nr:type I inositol-1,4,5-trisphosphate 5-phosphatase [Musa troglodytarum]URE20078.1 type I inositol-1,4,5-trisphosphate 5-phosphatase [Musa troglodytarum]